MKSQLHYLIVFICSAAVFTSAEPQSKNSLAEIYKSGTVRIVQEMRIDESSMPKDTYFEGYLRVACDDKGYVYPMFDSHKHATVAFSNNINRLGLGQNFGVCLQV